MSGLDKASTLAHVGQFTSALTFIGLQHRAVGYPTYPMSHERTSSRHRPSTAGDQPSRDGQVFGNTRALDVHMQQLAGMCLPHRASWARVFLLDGDAGFRVRPSQWGKKWGKNEIFQDR